MRLLPRVAIFFTLILSPSIGSAAGSDCRPFADHLRHQMLDLINDANKGYEQKHNELETLFIDALDMNTIAQSVAGDYWAEAKPDERDAFFKAYRAYLPDFYVGGFNEEDLNGISDVIITEFTKTSAGHFTALTQINQKYDDPIHAEFQIVTDRSGTCHIVDFKAEGVSMLDIQREEMLLLGTQGGLPFITKKLEERPRK